MGYWKKILGIVIIVCSIFLIFIWEKYGKEKLLYKDIPVLNKNVEAGEIIEKSMIRLKPSAYKGECLGQGDSDIVIGKIAKHFVHKDLPLFKEYFLDKSYYLGKNNDKYLLSIPEGAVLNKFPTLNKGDKIVFFLGKKELGDGIVSNIFDEKKKIDVVIRKVYLNNLSSALFSGGQIVVVRG